MELNTTTPNNKIFVTPKKGLKVLDSNGWPFPEKGISVVDNSYNRRLLNQGALVLKNNAPTTDNTVAETITSTPTKKGAK